MYDHLWDLIYLTYWLGCICADAPNRQPTLFSEGGNAAAPAPADSVPATNGAGAPAGTYICFAAL